MTFRSCREKDLIKKIRLTSEFMTAQPGSQTNAIHILTNISRSREQEKYVPSKIVQKMKQGD